VINIFAPFSNQLQEVVGFAPWRELSAARLEIRGRGQSPIRQQGSDLLEDIKLKKKKKERKSIKKEKS